MTRDLIKGNDQIRFDYCKRRKTALSAEKTNKRTNASTLAPLIERNWIGRAEFVEMFTDSCTFGIATWSCGPVAQTRFDRKLCALDSMHPVDRMIDSYTGFLSARRQFEWIGFGTVGTESG
jgi:hypothetical protein